MKINERDFSDEFEFTTSRSSGKGGQHVNKTESRVSLFFNVDNSLVLSESEKMILQRKLKSKIDLNGNIQVDVEKTRSQHKNKELAIKRFYKLIEQALKPEKKRKSTKPTQAAIRKRLKSKKRHAEKKQNRRKDNLL